MLVTGRLFGRATPLVIKAYSFIQECDAGRLSWDPSGDELTSMPYKEELTKAVTRRSKNLENDNDDDDDKKDVKKDDAAEERKPGSNGKRMTKAGSKSSFVGVDYEEVILPDDTVSMDSDLPLKSAPTPTPPLNENRRPKQQKSKPKAKLQSGEKDAVRYSKVNKQKKTDHNTKTKNGNQITSI